MNISKAWDWKKNKDAFWLEPSETSYYLVNRWAELGYRDFLDFGCGLGRHSIYFAKQGFNVTAFDLSEDGIEHTKNWAKDENLEVKATTMDMVKLEYDDNSFDCLFAYHVISHTTSKGIVMIIDEIKRVLRLGGEIYLSLCSKDTWAFKEANFPKVDENTVIKDNEPTEMGIPHFYVNLDDIFVLFKDFEISSIRHIDDCYFDGAVRNSKHYFITAKFKP